MNVLLWMGRVAVVIILWLMICFIERRKTICLTCRLLRFVLFVLMAFGLCVTLISIDNDFVSWLKDVWMAECRGLLTFSAENYWQLWVRHWPLMVVALLLSLVIVYWRKNPLDWLWGLSLPPKQNFRECGDDEPLDGKNLDMYIQGRKVFIEHVWRVIDNTASSKCSQCIGLFSSWGNGKTSVYNAIKNQCKRRDTIFVEFKPWKCPNFSEHPYVLFNTIAESIGCNCPTLSRAFARFSDNAEFKKTLSDIASTNGLLAGLRALFFCLGSDQKARKNLYKVLMRYMQHVVVVVDDLDRVAPDDVREVLRIVKTNDDLPCVTYLLLAEYEYLERSVQVAAPDPEDKEFGRRYLEKILSRRIDLPAIEPMIVIDELRRQLKAELGRLGFSADEIKNIDSDPMETIVPFIRNFRDLKRYKLNFLRLIDYMCGKCSEHTFSLSDVMAIAAVEVFMPNFYKQVSEFGLYCIEGAYRADNWIKENLLSAETPEYETIVKDFLKAHLGIRTLDGVSYVCEADGEDARRSYRLMSPDCFTVYFSDNVKNGVVSSADWHLIRKALNKSSEAYEGELIRLYKEKKLADYLKNFDLGEIEDHGGSFKVEYAIKGLISFGDQTLFHGDEWHLSFDEEIEKFYGQLLSVVELCIASIVGNDTKKRKVLEWLGNSLLAAGFVQCRMRNCFSDDDIETVRKSFLENISKAKVSEHWQKCDKRMLLEKYWSESVENNEKAREDFKKLHSDDVKNFTSAAILILQFKEKCSPYGTLLDVKRLQKYMGVDMGREMLNTFKDKKEDWSDFDRRRHRGLEILIFCLQKCVEANFQGCNVKTLGEWVEEATESQYVYGG